MRYISKHRRSSIQPFNAKGSQEYILIVCYAIMTLLHIRFMTMKYERSWLKSRPESDKDTFKAASKRYSTILESKKKQYFIVKKIDPVELTKELFSQSLMISVAKAKTNRCLNIHRPNPLLMISLNSSKRKLWKSWTPFRRISVYPLK